MRDTRSYVRMALVGVTLLCATAAGGAIGWLSTGGLIGAAGNLPPAQADVSSEPRAAIGTAPPSADNSAAPSPEPVVQPTPEPSEVPSTPTVAERPTAVLGRPEPTPSPTLQPLEVQTPVSPQASSSGPSIEYVVQPGDILGRVAQRFGVSVDAIVELNPEIDPDSLTVGERLLIPGE